jgi:mono/diheme cytochrome c family protein
MYTKAFSLFVILSVITALFGCSGSTSSETGGNDVARKGAALYARYCSSCHGKIEDTTRAGRSAARISSAIQHNIGGMGYLRSLKDDEIAAIAQELTLVAPPKDASGEELYRLYCASCHGPHDKSDIAGKTMKDVAAAVSRKVCSASNMKYLGEKEAAKIMDSLGKTAPPDERKQGN